MAGAAESRRVRFSRSWQFWGFGRQEELVAHVLESVHERQLGCVFSFVCRQVIADLRDERGGFHGRSDVRGAGLEGGVHED